MDIIVLVLAVDEVTVMTLRTLDVDNEHREFVGKTVQGGRRMCSEIWIATR